MNIKIKQACVYGDASYEKDQVVTVNKAIGDKLIAFNYAEVTKEKVAVEAVNQKDPPGTEEPAAEEEKAVDQGSKGKK